jgi:hypothetical protein
MRAFATSAFAVAALAAPALAGTSGAPAPASAATYKEMAVFNHVVGDTRFVGNFMAEAGHCAVTLFETHAGDAALRAPVRSLVLPIAAGASGRIGVGPTSALEIACAADADSIRVSP